MKNETLEPKLLAAVKTPKPWVVGTPRTVVAQSKASFEGATMRRVRKG